MIAGGMGEGGRTWDWGQEDGELGQGEGEPEGLGEERTERED